MIRSDTWQADGACHGDIEDERISLLVLYTTITQNATSPLARSRYSPSVKSPGVKYVSGVLFFTRCMLPPEGSGGATKETREEDKAEDVQRGRGLLACSCFFDCSRNIVIAAAAFPRYSSTFELRLLSRSNWMTAKCRCCHITVSTEDITEGCFVGHAASLRDFLRNFCCFDGHTSTRISSSFHRFPRLLDAKAEYGYIRFAFEEISASSSL